MEMLLSCHHTQIMVIFQMLAQSKFFRQYGKLKQLKFKYCNVILYHKDYRDYNVAKPQIQNMYTQGWASFCQRWFKPSFKPVTLKLVQ